MYAFLGQLLTIHEWADTVEADGRLERWMDICRVNGEKDQVGKEAD